MDLRASDDTDPGSVKRLCRVYERVGRHGVRWNGRYRYYLVSSGTYGAEQIPQKSINVIRSEYRKTMMDYWLTVDPRIRERAERMSKYVKDPDPE